MKIIIQCSKPYVFYQKTLPSLLRSAGAQVVYHQNRNFNMVPPHTTFLSHHILTRELASILEKKTVSVRAGRNWGRAYLLQLAETFQIPTLEWAPATDTAAAELLLQSWGGHGIYKRDTTHSSSGVSLIEPIDFVPSMFDGQSVFNRPLQSSSLIKVETLGSQHLISWTRETEGLESLHSVAQGKSRTLWDCPEELMLKILACSQALAEQGAWHCSFDFLLDADNQQAGPQLIEINTSEIALWWTTEQPGFNETFTQALLALLQPPV